MAAGATIRRREQFRFPGCGSCPRARAVMAWRNLQVSRTGSAVESARVGGCQHRRAGMGDRGVDCGRKSRLNRPGLLGDSWLWKPGGVSCRQIAQLGSRRRGGIRVRRSRLRLRMVRSLRAETGSTAGTVRRVAEQLGYGVESVRAWVKQADIDDGALPGTTAAEAERLRSWSRRTGSCGARMRSCGERRLSSGRSSTASSADSGVHRRQQGRCGGRP